MKKELSVTILLSTLVLSVWAQNPDIKWQKRLDGSAAEWATDCIATPDGGYLVLGTTGSDSVDVSGNHGNADIWLIKLDSLHNKVWQHCYGGSNEDEGERIISTGDGNYLILGTSYSSDGDVINNYGLQDGLVIKIDSSGNILWEKNYGGSSVDFFYRMARTNDNGFILSGATRSTDYNITSNQGVWDGWVVKIDSVGDIVWQKTYGGTKDDQFYGVAVTDTGYVLVGLTASNDGDIDANQGIEDVWVVSLDTSGNWLWGKTYGGSGDEQGLSIAVTNDGGYVLSGWTTSTDGVITNLHGNTDALLIKIDKIGSLQWEKTYGGSSQDFTETQVYQLCDNSYVFAGRTKSNDGDITTNYGYYDGWIVRADSMGNIIWQKNIGGSEDEYFFNDYLTSDNGLVAVGFTRSVDNYLDTTTALGDQDLWVLRVDLEAVCTTGDTTNIDNFSVEGLSVYPNPSVDGTFIVYLGDMATTGAKVEIMDITGKQLQILMVKPLQKAVQLHVAVAGMYFVRVVTQSSSKTVRLVVGGK